MKSLQLTEKHKVKLLEMCKKLFPEYKEIYWNSGTGSNGSSEHIGFGVQHPTVSHWIDYTYIHWLQVCIYNIIPKLELESFWTDSVLEDMLIKANHPVDYLYVEFKKIK